MAADDEEIYKAFAVDPDKGFRLLMASYSRPVYAYVRRLVVRHDDTEDVCQEVFIRVFRSWNKFKRESALSTWIYRIATREAVRFLHRQGNRVSMLDPSAEEVGRLEAPAYFDYDDALAVKFQRAIQTLTEKQRLVFNLRYYDELDYAEIGRILDCPENTLKVHYHNAKEKIKEFITKN